MLIHTLVYLFLSEFLNFARGLQCMDPTNSPVDWYVIYKLPKQQSHSNPSIKRGLGFMYMTSKGPDQWAFSEVDINDTNSMVAHTLNPQGQDPLYLLYNDQPPYGAASIFKGHTKGAVMADASGGFWLIHSVPHFPPSIESYAYPKSGTHFGQSFLCLSLSFQDLDNVGLQLQYNEPHIYAQNIPGYLRGRLPEICKAAGNETVKATPWYHVQNISSKAGVKFMSFAKAGKFSKDLYADLVSPVLGTDLYVETWPNEPNRLPSNCQHQYQVDNILTISSQDFNVSFRTSVDHSKWAVSAPKDLSKWICIGDINRAQPQTKRGGGTTCLNKEPIARNYLRLVASVQKCTNQSDSGI